MRPLLCFAVILLGSAGAWAQDQAPPAPVVPSSQAPPVPAVTMTVAPAPAPAPTQAMTAAPAPQAQTVTLPIMLQVVAAAAPAAPPMQAMTAPVQAVNAPVMAQLVHPGLIRRAIGTMGEHLARQKMARVYVPLPTTQVQVQAAPVTMTVVPQQTAAMMAAPPVQAMVLPSSQAPSGFHRGSLFPFRR